MIRLALLFLVVASGCATTKEQYAKLWFRDLERLYNWVQADNEARKYKEEESQARKYLEDVRAIPDPYAIASKLRGDGFHWAEERFDFVSYPWVTIARRRGDCDDFMELWKAIFKWRGKTERVFVASTGGTAHAMLLFTDTSAPPVLYLLSNVNVLGRGRPGEEEQLIRLFYRERTEYFVRY